jgi:lipopolysaccharide export LptBFGC system permease protein LptF
MFLLPQALAISIPVGATIGIAVGLARQQMSMRLITLVAALAFACSIGSVANLGWLVPNENQAFRTAAFRKVSQTPPPKGDNELTFAELDRLIERREAFPVGSYEWDDVNRLRTGYHMRWALAFATFALALFAASLLRWTRRRWAISVGIVAAIFGYYVLLFAGRSLALHHALAPPVAAWLANGVFAVVSAALMTLSARRQAVRSIQAAS